MKLHGNARTCPHSRALAIGRIERKGWTLSAAAEAAGISVRTVSKWRRRYREEGEQGLLDRSSAPASIPHRTPEERVQAIAALRVRSHEEHANRRARGTELSQRRAALVDPRALPDATIRRHIVSPDRKPSSSTFVPADSEVASLRS